MYRSRIRVSPASSEARSEGSASHRFAEKRRCIAWSSSGALEEDVRYEFITWPIGVVRSGSGGGGYISRAQKESAVKDMGWRNWGI